jgi:large subunit ribosomal protein L10
MKREQKQALIEEMHRDFGGAPHGIVLDFRGLSVPAVTEFRQKVRQAGSRYRVVKNTLALRALEGTPLERLSSYLKGTNGLAYTGDDPAALAKVLVDFAKDHPALVVKGGVVDAQALDAEGVKALSAMPSLPELRSMLLGTLQAPAAKLVRLLGTPAQQLVQVVKAKADKEQEQG